MKTTKTEIFQNGLSKTCKYRDFSMNRVCYYHDNARYIDTCEGCHEDGRNTSSCIDATRFAERGKNDE